MLEKLKGSVLFALGRLIIGATLECMKFFVVAGLIIIAITFLVKYHSLYVGVALLLLSVAAFFLIRFMIRLRVKNMESDSTYSTPGGEDGW